jgi:hypothetical protein
MNHDLKAVDIKLDTFQMGPRGVVDQNPPTRGRGKLMDPRMHPRLN